MSASIAERVAAVLEGGGAEALLFEEQWVSWSELGRQARAVRSLLTSVPRDCAIVHVVRNRPSGVAALLGLVADKRCVLQVSPIQPPASLAAEIARLNPAAIVADAEDWSEPVRLAAAEIGALGIEHGKGIAAVIPDWQARSDPSHAAAPPEVAILMPTSGTTGPPKRVPITFRQLETYRADRDGQAIGAAPRVVIVAAPMFTVTGLRPMLAWATRPLRMALMERVDVERWAGLVARYRPRDAGLPPAALRMLLDSSVPRDALSSLKSWNTGSAPVDPDVAERFEGEFGVPVLVGYGATEFGGAVAWMTLEDRQRWGNAKRGSSGRALPGNSLRIVSQDGGVLPAGESGLLEVSAARTGGAWMKTNDLAHIDEDGFLYIEGRADDVIIRGGFKVPLGEVEALLETHPAVRQAAVLAEHDERLGQVPIAAVSLREGAGNMDEAALDRWARENIAPYKRPVRIAILDALPMTASMKVNRPELRRLMAERMAAAL